MAKNKKRKQKGGLPFNPDTDTGIRRPVTARVAVGMSMTSSLTTHPTV
ncbi:hypothetical protein [Petralouisia muris]